MKVSKGFQRKISENIINFKFLYLFMAKIPENSLKGSKNSLKIPENMAKIPENSLKYRKNARREIVRQEYIKLGGNINKLELSKKLNCDYKTISDDVKSVEETLTPELLAETRKKLANEAVEKYGKNLIDEIVTGQNLIRLVINQSIQTRGPDGKVLDPPVILCSPDVLLSRLEKAEKIKDMHTRLMEAWFLKDKAAEKVENTVKLPIEYYRERAVKALEEEKEKKIEVKTL
jgi:hypothetical protein